jgi:glycosyltransferase involved in cell wall biosynthesis
VQWILECLIADPPDIFVPNLVIAGYFAGRWAQVAGIPTVGVLHSDDDFYRAIQSEFVFGSRDYRVTSLVCVSASLEAQVRERCPDGVSISRIPYGIPIPETPIRGERESLHIAFVGRLAEEQKRISDVARALCAVVRQIPGTEATLFGDGPDREVVAAILSDEGGGLPVKLAGLIPSDEIQLKLMEIDVIVLLSDYEGLPIALMEGMACGCVPVCLAMKSGISELVEHGITGLIVKDRGEDFVAKIKRLRDDPVFRKSLSTAARTKVANRFSLSASNDKWADLFLTLTPSGPVSSIQIPNRLRLPAPRSPLESRLNRQSKMSVVSRLFTQPRRLAGLIKRRLLRTRRSAALQAGDKQKTK